MNEFTLPDTLVTQLRAFERRLRRMETLVAVAGWLVGLLTTFLLLFVLDRFVDTPRVVRVLLTLGGAGVAAWFAQRWAKHWLWQRRGPAQLAKLLQSHFRKLGDRLQGIIELTESGDLPANISPALLRAAVRQVAAEAERFDFPQAVPVRPARRWGFAAAGAMAITLAAFLFVPKAATNALARWLAPWAKIDRYTFASLAKLPRELVVAHGEPFEIVCGLKADSAWKPETATARLNRTTTLETKLQDERAVFHLPGQTQPGTLLVRVGDASREIRILPMHRPEMKALAARVQLPDYLGHPVATVPIPGGSAQFLEGSTVQFSGTISRNLQQATMKSAVAAPAVEVAGETFTTPPAPVNEITSGATFRWKDRHGLTPTQPYQLGISTTKDAEPRVELKGLESEIAILPHEMLKLSFASTDDFGVKDTWLGWTVKALGEKKTELGKGEAAHTKGSQLQRELSGQADFSPLWHDIPEDSVVELAAYAVDYLPSRTPIESWRHTIHVLSPARHAERVQQRMEQVLKQLDERIRDEERQLEETKMLAENKAALASEKMGEDIKRVEAGEQANAKQTEKLTEEMKAVMQDALRNKEVPEGTLADWQQLMKQLDEQAQPLMAQAGQNLQKAAEQTGSREEELSKAQEQQKKALEALRQAANKMQKTNENLFARNFYNRLRAAAATEHKIADGLTGLAKTTVGLRPDEIAESDRKHFDRVAADQDTAASDVGRIATDMANFVKRVPNEKYSAVQQAMQDRRVVAELTELSGYVRANLGLKSVGRAKLWGNQLDEWASQLQTECKAQGEGDGETNPDLLELIVAMVRAAQAEDNIREQTLLVDARKDTNRQHAEDAAKVAAQQVELQNTIAELREKTPIEDVKPLLQKVETLMDEVAVNLRAPNTSEDVVGTEGMIIELLVPPDKKGGQSASMSKMQPMMQKMMAQAKRAAKPGGSASPNPSGLAGNAAEGAAGRGKQDARNLQKAGGGMDAGDWPEEFRDQLQAYLQQLEAGGK